MCETLNLTDIINWEPTEAKQRIPKQFAGNSFFSRFDLYQYIAITDDRTCKTCMIYDRMITPGNYLRAYFPFMDIINDDQILPRVHPNCRCTLLRVTNLADYITYTEPIPDFPSQTWTEPTYTKDLKKWKAKLKKTLNTHSKSPPQKNALSVAVLRGLVLMVQRFAWFIWVRVSGRVITVIIRAFKWHLLRLQV